MVPGTWKTLTDGWRVSPTSQTTYSLRFWEHMNTNIAQSKKGQKNEKENYNTAFKKKIKFKGQHISTSDQDGVTGTGFTLVHKKYLKQIEHVEKNCF